MNITYAPNDILQIDNARIIYRNFAGVGRKFNRESDRNFAVIIPTEEMKDKLIQAGWNVKIKPPRDDQDTPFMYLPVKIKFNDRGPNVYLITGDRKNRLTEGSVGCIDDIDISSVNLDIRPYDWGPVNGKYGRTAYLQAMEVIQEIDRFAARYDEFE